MIGTYVRDASGRLRVSQAPYRGPPLTPPPPSVEPPLREEEEEPRHLPDGVGAQLLVNAAGVALIGAKVVGEAAAARERIAHRSAAATAADRRRLVATLESVKPESPPTRLQAADRLRTAVVQGEEAVVQSLVRDTHTANSLYSAPQSVPTPPTRLSPLLSVWLSLSLSVYLCGSVLRSYSLPGAGVAALRCRASGPRRRGEGLAGEGRARGHCAE